MGLHSRQMCKMQSSTEVQASSIAAKVFNIVLFCCCFVFSNYITATPLFGPIFMTNSRDTFEKIENCTEAYTKFTNNFDECDVCLLAITDLAYLDIKCQFSFNCQCLGSNFSRTIEISARNILELTNDQIIQMIVNEQVTTTYDKSIMIRCTFVHICIWFFICSISDGRHVILSVNNRYKYKSMRYVYSFIARFYDIHDVGLYRHDVVRRQCETSCQTIVDIAKFGITL